MSNQHNPFPTREERSARGTRPKGGVPFRRQTTPYLRLKGVVCLLKGSLPFQVFVIYEKSVIINKVPNPVPTLFYNFQKVVSKGVDINYALILLRMFADNYILEWIIHDCHDVFPNAHVQSSTLSVIALSVIDSTTCRFNIETLRHACYQSGLATNWLRPLLNVRGRKFNVQ